MCPKLRWRFGVDSLGFAHLPRVRMSKRCRGGMCRKLHVRLDLGCLCLAPAEQPQPDPRPAPQTLLTAIPEKLTIL